MSGKGEEMYQKIIKQFMRCKKELNWTNEQLAERFGLPPDMVEQIFREMGDDEDSGVSY